MKIRLHFLGILVHGLLLFWSNDIYSNYKNVDVRCPYFVQNEEQQKEENGKPSGRRLLFLVIRNPNYYDEEINGIDKNFFVNFPKVIYIGESLLSEYYMGADAWQKIVLPFNTSHEELMFIKFEEMLNRNEWLGNITVPIYFLVDSNNINGFNKRSMLYVKHKMEELRLILNVNFNDSNTICFIYNENNKKIWLWPTPLKDVNINQENTTRNPSKSQYVIKEGILNRYRDLVPLIAGLISYDIPHHGYSIAPLYLLNTEKEKTITFYCNALNLLNLTRQYQENLGIFQVIIKNSLNFKLVNQLTTFIESLINTGNYSGGLYLTKMLIANSTTDYVRSVLTINSMKCFLIVLTIIGWILILLVEYLQISTGLLNSDQPTSYSVHIIFFILSILLLFVPQLQKWPYYYHFYFQTPILIFWIVCARIKYFKFFLSKLNRKNINSLAIFIFLLILTEEYFIFNVQIELTITVASLLPCLSKFRRVPFFFIIIWFLTSCFLIINAFSLRENLEPAMKYINSSGTIWLLFAGLCMIIIKPKSQFILVCFNIIFLTISLWLQNACFSTNGNCRLFLYFMWPLFLCCLLPFILQTSTKNKIIQMTLSSAVLIVLTSALLQPVSLLIILIYTASWALLESHYQISHWDNIRRMSFLLYLIILIDTLITTDYTTFKCLLCFHSQNLKLYKFLLTKFRLFILFTCVISTYRLVIGVKNYAYATVLLASLVLSIAALRLLITINNCSLLSDGMKYLLKHLNQINSWAIMLIAASEIALIYARNSKHLAITPSSIQSFHQLTQI